MKAVTYLTLLVSLALPARSASPWTTAAAPGVGFEQPLGQALPLATRFRDQDGRAVRLGEAFGAKPVILIFGYARCPQLCSVVAQGIVESLRRLEATAGRDFHVVYVSIDPTDTPRELAGLRRRDVGRYGRTGSASGWTYLAGDAESVRAVAVAAGFRYTYDSRSRLFAHASGFLVATPDGRVSRTFLGVDFRADEIATALKRAAAGGIGEPTFNLLLLCQRGLGIAGRYGAIIWSTLAVSVGLTVLGVFGGIGWMLAAERRTASRRPTEGAP